MNCLFEARQANEFFGSRIGSFTNNTTGWDTFKTEMDAKLSGADAKCSCGDDACKSAADAINQLRSMVNDMDSAVRSNSGVPTDLVQRQERVDQALDAAQSSAK